jgi:hypothetical protein
VRNVIVGHGKNGDLSDGSVPAHDTTGALVDGGQIRVHVTGETATTGDFFAGGGHLTEGIAVGRKISENDQDVLLKLVSVVFGGCECKAGRDDTFDAIGWLARGQVRAIKRTYVGSLARLRNSVVRSKLPFSSKSRVKKRAVSRLTPMAANTMEKFSSWPSWTPLFVTPSRCTNPACRQIWAAISLCGRPEAEKIGIFCPRAIEFMVSMAEIPVEIISSGYTCDVSARDL